MLSDAFVRLADELHAALECQTLRREESNTDNCPHGWMGDEKGQTSEQSRVETINEQRKGVGR